MTSPDYELGYLEAGLEVLEGYLLSAEIYWPIGASSPAGDPPYPKMTLGNFLLNQRKAQAWDLNADQTSRFARVQQAVDKVRLKWRTAWEQKAQKEYQSRLTLWKNFMDEYRENPGNNVDRYDYEVSRRVMLDLLRKEAAHIPEEQKDLLDIMDGLLEAVFILGSFIWDEQVASEFPRKTFWYLYGRPQEEQ